MHTLRMSLIVITSVLLSHHEAISIIIATGSEEIHVITWAGHRETYAVPSVIMTRERDNRDYVATLQKLLIAILLNKETLDSTGHPK